MSSLVAPPRNAVDVFPQYVSIPTLDSPPAGRPRKGTHDRSSSTSMPATPSTTMKSRPKLKESCDHCAKAKVKCNKDQPTCSRCRDRHLHCGYSYSRRAGRRPGRSDSITQPTSPESCSLASPTATSSSTPNWSSNGMPSSSSMTEIISTAAGSVDSYPASLASPYMSPYMMPTVPTDQFGGYLDGYSVSSSPVNSTFGFGSLSVDHSPTMTASYSSSAGAQNPTLHGVNAFHVAGASGSAFDSSRTDIPGHPMTFTNTAMPVIPPTTNSALLPEAWLRDGQPAAATTLECRFAQTGETCVARLTKALSTQATSSTEPSTVADLMAANRSILHIAVMILSCSCASRNPQLLNLLVYAARIIITRYEIGASSGIASGNLLGDIPYLERFLSILAETLTRSGDAWAAASLDFGNGPQHHRRSLSSFSTIPAPLVEVCTRTLALKALLRQNLVAATV